ncbi:MAG TPA: TIGR04438 family Trp-rich protein [Burkholderiaceae bacterium]|jgi:small Trp-rich protein
MWFVVLGTLLVVLKVADFGSVAGWSWWLVLSPFPLAIVWWAWSDSMGFTQKEQMRKMEQKKADRRNKALESLGIKRPSSRRERAAEDVRKRLAAKVEGERTKVRERNKEEVRESVFHQSRLSSQFDPDSAEPTQKKK